MTQLPDADDVFLRYFARWYESDELARRGYEATRPDLEQCYPRGISGREASPLTPEGQADVADRIRSMLDAAAGDWPDMLGVSGRPGPEWVETFDAFYDRVRVAEVLDASDPADFGNELLVLCCEFGAVLGAVLQTEAPQLEWVYDWPYWESGLVDPAHGYRISVFHWAVKKFSDYGVEDGFAAKVKQCARLVETGWS